MHWIDAWIRDCSGDVEILLGWVGLGWVGLGWVELGWVEDLFLFMRIYFYF